MIEDITVVSYLTEKHKDWLPYWCEQLNTQTAHGFRILVIAHNWKDHEAVQYIGSVCQQHLDEERRSGKLVVERFESPPTIGHVIDYACSLVDTTYFAHWDIDDHFHPQRLELQAKYLEEHPDVDFLNARSLGFIDEPKQEMLDMDYFAPDEPYADVTDNDQIMKCLLDDNKNCLAHGLMIYKTDVMKRLGGFSHLNVRTDKLGRSPDHETWKKALMAGYKFHRLPQLLMLWNLKSSAIRDTKNAKE